MAEYLISKRADVASTDTIGSRTALHYACYRANNSIVTALLKARAPIDVQDKDGRTPLSYAIMRGASARKVVETLLLHDADVELADHSGRNFVWECVAAAIGKALSADELECLRSLLGAGAEVKPDHGGVHPLHIAAHRDLATMIDVLLDRDPRVLSDLRDKNGRTPLHYAARTDAVAAATKLLLRAKRDGAKSADEPNAAVVRLLSATDSLGRTAYHEAALLGSTRVTRLLLSALRGSIDETSDAVIQIPRHLIETVIDLPDASRRIALHDASSSGNTVAVKLLLSASPPDLRDISFADWKAARINTPDARGRTALHRAAGRGAQQTVALLLRETGIAVDAADIDGVTPLMVAQYHEHSATERALLAEGANPSAKDRLGRTAADYAQRGEARRERIIAKRRLRRQQRREQARLAAEQQLQQQQLLQQQRQQTAALPPPTTAAGAAGAANEQQAEGEHHTGALSFSTYTTILGAISTTSTPMPAATPAILLPSSLSFRFSSSATANTPPFANTHHSAQPPPLARMPTVSSLVLQADTWAPPSHSPTRSPPHRSPHSPRSPSSPPLSPPRTLPRTPSPPLPSSPRGAHYRSSPTASAPSPTSPSSSSPARFSPLSYMVLVSLVVGVCMILFNAYLDKGLP